MKGLDRIVEETPNLNSRKIFKFPFQITPKGVSISPIIKIGNSKKTCPISSTLNKIPRCQSYTTDDSSEPECSDGKDNDDDTFTDYPADPGCTDPDDDSERELSEECSNGEDDDDDGWIDLADPGCIESDEEETKCVVDDDCEEDESCVEGECEDKKK